MLSEETHVQPSQSEEEELTYHAVEKEGSISAIWEMKGKKHIRTIDPKSREGQDLLEAYKPSESEDTSSDAPEASDASSE